MPRHWDRIMSEEERGTSTNGKGPGTRNTENARGLETAQPAAAEEVKSPFRQKTPLSVKPSIKEFDPKCIKVKPKIYLIDEFFTRNGNLTDFPKETFQFFERTLWASFDLLKVRAKGIPAQELFDFRRVKSLENVPEFLGSGDIVLGCAHLPIYSVERSSLSIIGSLAEEGRGLNRVVEQVHNRFWKVIVQRWKKVAQNPPPTNPPLKDADRIATALSDVGRLVLRLHTGQQITASYAIHIGVVDVAYAAVQAIKVVKSESDRNTVFRILDMKGSLAQFGPQAVNAVAKAKIKDPRGYLSTVGQQLGYHVLHEFWHNANGRSGHPHGRNVNIIEGNPEDAGYEGLVLLEEARNNILQNYEKNWCSDILKRTKMIGDIQP